MGRGYYYKSLFYTCFDVHNNSVFRAVYVYVTVYTCASIAKNYLLTFSLHGSFILPTTIIIPTGLNAILIIGKKKKGS